MGIRPSTSARAPRAATRQPHRRVALRSRAVSLPDAFRAPDRKDSTPRHGRLLHPYPRRNEMIAITPSKICFQQGGSPKQATPLTVPATSLTAKNRLRQISGDGAWMKNLKPKSPPTGGFIIEVRRQDKMRLASRPRRHAARPPRRLHPALRSRCAPRSRSSLYDCAKKAYNLVTRRREGTFYPDETEIQEAHSKHRKLDS